MNNVGNHIHTCKYNLQNEWNDTRKEAYLYDKLSDNNVQCKLCPRKCLIKPNSVGVCKVRKNIDGILYAQTYQKSARLAIEKIEAEGIFHYMPNTDILSLGTVGCNLNCSYCQNWVLSQVEYVAPSVISECTSEDIIEKALKNNIEILAWTYNEPAVWFEFVIDTARLAKKYGLKNLFKSAYFVSEEAIDYIIDVADVFAVSLKSMNDKYYRNNTGGWIEPVLNCIRKIYNSGKPVEIENLIVTGLNDNDDDYIKTINFVLNELDKNVPLHFSAFHPDYKYSHVERVKKEEVDRARELAIDNGIKHVYVGNYFETKGLHTYCCKCGNLLVERKGLSSKLRGIDENGCCIQCKEDNHIIIK